MEHLEIIRKQHKTMKRKESDGNSKKDIKTNQVINICKNE